MIYTFETMKYPVPSTRYSFVISYNIYPKKAEFLSFFSGFEKPKYLQEF